MLLNQGFLMKGKKPEGLKIRIEVSANESYRLPTHGASNNLVVDWGDGTVKRYCGSALERPGNRYIKAGQYIVHIWGRMEKFSNHNYPTTQELEVVSLGNDFKVQNQMGMFANCAKLTKAKLSGYRHFNTMRYLFWKSPNIASIQMEDTQLDAVTSTDSMFWGLGQNMNDFSFLKGFKNIKEVSSMFYRSQSQHIDLTHFDMSRVENLSGMFQSSTKLAHISFPQKPWHNATNCSYFAFNTPMLRSQIPPELFWEKTPAFTHYDRAFSEALNIENHSSIPPAWK